jgi:flagellar motor switch protein FliM
MPYELVSPENIITPILATLDTVFERFAHSLQITLSELLRCELALAPNALEIRTLGDFLGSLAAPASLTALTLAPLAGPGLLVFEQPLVFLLVDTFFGGKGQRLGSPGGREFTTVERRLIQRLQRLSLNALEVAWQPYLEVRCSLLGHESNPQFVTTIEPPAAIALITLPLTLAGKEASGGKLHLVLPCAMFEPVRAQLLASGKEHTQRSERLAKLLGEGIKESFISVRGLLAETELTLRDLLELRAGDFIPMSIPEFAVLEAEGIRLYAGRYGQFQGQRAVKIKHSLAAGKILLQEDAKS